MIKNHAQQLYPTTTAWCLNPSAARSMDDISAEMFQQISALGFSSISYESAPYQFQSDFHKADKKLRLFTLDSLAESSATLVAGDLPEDYLAQYFRNFAMHDPNFRQVIKLEHQFIHELPNNRHERELIELMDYRRDHGIRSSITWPLKAGSGPYWCGLFSLNSSLSNQQLKDHLNQIKQPLSQLLLLYHIELQSCHKQNFNPFLNTGIINRNALLIISNIAQGKSSKEIAREVHLSERGVEYHIKEMKYKFKARNRQHLVHIIHQLGLL